jgi:hypothetical protein
MEVNGRPHALATLIPWKEGPLLMKKGAVWAPEPIWKIKNGDLSLIITLIRYIYIKYSKSSVNTTM